MRESLRILFISAEVAPFAKKGGLGDVAGSLPKALKEMGHDVRVVMPAYQNIEESIANGHYDLKIHPGQLKVPLGGQSFPAGILESLLPGSDVPIYFIAEKNMFNRAEIYGYADDSYRFAFFSRAALDLSAALAWRPDILHAHDWHTGPAVTWLATSGQADPHFHRVPSLFTIHNLAHQGRSDWNIQNYLGISPYSLDEEGYGEVNFMARAILHATMINTVSPTYSREILTPSGGAGLDGLLRHRSYDVHGILNGLDYQEWNPATDSRLASTFDSEELASRRINRRALQERANLPLLDNVPLVAMITRLDFQKGLDISGHVIHSLMNAYAGEAQLVILGSGEAEYERMLVQIASYHREKMTVFLDYMPELAPLIYGGSDMFLMPSRFEPCGLGQLIAMRYGSVPVVRATGGLVDTVEDGITGFHFQEYNADAFWLALQRAINVFHTDKEGWQRIQRAGMQADFSWTRSANGYQQLYQWALARIAG